MTILLVGLRHELQKKNEANLALLAQKHRKEAQEIQAKREVTRQPLSIQHPLQKPSISERVEKEKQISFFFRPKSNSVTSFRFIRSS